MEGQVRGLRSTFGHSPPSAACPLIPTEPRTLPRRRDSPAPRNHIDILRKTDWALGFIPAAQEESEERLKALTWDEFLVVDVLAGRGRYLKAVQGRWKNLHVGKMSHES
eukprot:1177152-Prorocentrum_minimum.AAC.5